MFFEILLQAFPDWLSLEAVLAWLVAGGSVFAVNYGLALLAENWAMWHNFPKWLKFLIPVVVSVLLAFGAQYLLSRPDLIGIAQPVWAMIVTVFLAWIGSQKGYMSARSSSYGAKKR
jgi:hypothetical protein